jgi:hypothetical protein
MKIAGVILIVLGLGSLIWGGVPYNKTENVAQFGELKMQVTEKKVFTVPPWLAGIAILGGAALLFAGGRKPAA